jgi:hypothetical protein
MWRFPIGGYLFVADQRLETLDQHNIYGSDLFAEIGKKKKRNKGALTWRTCGGRVAADVAGGGGDGRPARWCSPAAFPDVSRPGRNVDDVRLEVARRVAAAAWRDSGRDGRGGQMEAARLAALRREIRAAWGRG